MRQLSLAPLTVPALAPPEFIICAAQAGYSRVALRLLQGNPLAPTALLNNPALLRETQRRLRSDGVSVAEIEVLVLDSRSRIDDCMPMLEVSAALGASHLLVSVSDTDFARASANFAELCRRAAPFGLAVNIEFVPYTAVRTLDQACALATAAGAANAGVLIDAIHFDRAGHVAADIAPFPSHLFAYVQLCDAPAERPGDMQEIIRQSRQERLYPGEGGLDIPGVLRALPAHLPISIEVPHLERIERIGEVAHARCAREQVLALLQKLENT